MSVLLVCLTFQHGCFETLPVKCKGRRGTMNSVTDFEQLTKCTTFVDKTLMIPVFFNNAGSRQFQLITCPPKFGKTINLNMMKRFVEINVDEKGREQPYRNLSTRYIFANKSFGLKIADLIHSAGCDLHDKHLNAYPVIYVTFKDVVGNTYESIVRSLRDNLKRCFEGYQWLYEALMKKHPDKSTNNQTLIGYQIEIMRKILQGRTEEEDIVGGLYELTKILYKYFQNKGVFLIIDDYDSPIINAIENNLDAARVLRLIEVMFLKLFHSDDPYIQYALIAGTFNVLDKAKLGNIKHWNFMDSRQFAQFFGFIENEVDTLLNKHGIRMDEEKLLKSYYKGYTVVHANIKMYNPFSIVNYLSNRNPECTHVALESYWAETSRLRNSLQHFKKNRESSYLLSKLLTAKKTTFFLKKHFTVDELEKLKQMKHAQGYIWTSHDEEIFFSYLYHNGFLTHINESSTYTIPNREIESYMNVALEKDGRGPSKNFVGLSFGSGYSRDVSLVYVTRNELKIRRTQQPKSSQEIPKYVCKSVTHFEQLEVTALSVQETMIYVGMSTGEIETGRLDLDEDLLLYRTIFFSSSEIGIASLLAHRNKLYVGKTNGEMSVCSLTSSSSIESCSYLNKANNTIITMFGYGNYIFVGLKSGEIWRCSVGEVHFCKTWDQFYPQTIISLVIDHYYIYAVISPNATLWRCLVDLEHACEPVGFLNKNANVLATSSVLDKLYFGSKTGEIFEILSFDGLNREIVKENSAIVDLAVI